MTIDTGTVLHIIDMVPNHTSPMHRTNSVDYGIVLSGEVDLLLDDGSAAHFRTGDLIVQRGTLHAWRNPDPERTCRIAFVLVGAIPVSVDG